MFQAGLPAGAMLAGADASSNQPEAQPPRMEPQAQPKEAQHSSPSATDLAFPQQAAQSPEAAVDTAESAGSAAWEGLLDLSPMPGNLTMASNMAFLDSPDMDTLSTLCQVSSMGSSGGRPTPVLFQGTSAAMQDMAQHAQQQAREAASDSVNTAAPEDAAAGNDPRLAALQDEESVGSASPADAAGMHSRSEVPVASDTGASGVRTRPAPAQVSVLLLLLSNIVRNDSRIEPGEQLMGKPCNTILLGNIRIDESEHRSWRQPIRAVRICSCETAIRGRWMCRRNGSRRWFAWCRLSTQCPRRCPGPWAWAERAGLPCPRRPRSARSSTLLQCPPRQPGAQLLT